MVRWRSVRVVAAMVSCEVECCVFCLRMEVKRLGWVEAERGGQETDTKAQTRLSTWPVLVCAIHPFPIQTTAKYHSRQIYHTSSLVLSVIAIGGSLAACFSACKLSLASSSCLFHHLRHNQNINHTMLTNSKMAYYMISNVVLANDISETHDDDPKDFPALVGAAAADDPARSKWEQVRPTSSQHDHRGR